MLRKSHIRRIVRISYYLLYPSIVSVFSRQNVALMQQERTMGKTNLYSLTAVISTL